MKTKWETITRHLLIMLGVITPAVMVHSFCDWLDKRTDDNHWFLEIITTYIVLSAAYALVVFACSRKHYLITIIAVIALILLIAANVKNIPHSVRIVPPRSTASKVAITISDMVLGLVASLCGFSLREKKDPKE